MIIIELFNFFNGHLVILECQDTSDESVEYCASKCCPPFGFRCGYGACVDEKARCDGNFDCFDQSDENYLLCGYPESGRPQAITTTSTTERPAFDPNKIYFTNPFDNIPQGRFFEEMFFY